MILRACGLAVAVAYLVSATAALSQSSVAYQYDAMGRLTQSTYATCAESAYLSDNADNRTRVMTVPGGTLTALDDTVNVNENSAITFDPRANDCSTQSYALTITGVGAASHGTVSYTSSSVTYTPTTNYYGADSFSYSISDGHSNTASATVNVTVLMAPLNAAANPSSGSPIGYRGQTLYSSTTVSATGGSGGYTYQWTETDSYKDVTFGSTGSTNTFVLMKSTSGTYYRQFNCLVTDSAGHTTNVPYNVQYLFN